jgi:UDP-N-acetylmuramoyl-L-alanyl-D-glutamate--2,6-diaminopimelate ligase
MAVKNATERVTGLAVKLSQVKPGSVYFAYKGSTTPEMVAKAIEAGAVAVVGKKQHPWDLPADVAYVGVENIRLALAQAAASFYPLQPETIVAVTGTAGKSSVVDFSRQLFAALGHRAASMGTIGLVAPEKITYNSTWTTPSPISLHETLNRLALKGLQHLAMEASSAGLDRHRLDCVRLSAAGFTNLGHDHLDYHASIETYFAAKMRLFKEVLPDGRTAVVNADGAYAERVIAAVRAQGRPLMTVGRRGEDIRLLEARREGQGQHLVLNVYGAKHEIHFPLLGAFQIENALLAAGLVMATTGQRDEVLSALSRLQGVPGRLEHVVDVNGAQCFVDYAHKPEALASVLEALRPITSGRLVCVFGCEGDKYQGKRPMMGRIASEKADVVIVTDDSPRTEDPATVRAQILAAAPAAREIGDRGEAIRTAVRELRPGDVLVVAGKGHETSQVIGRSTIPFSDHEVLVAATRDTEPGTETQAKRQLGWATRSIGHKPEVTLDAEVNLPGDVVMQVAKEWHCPDPKRFFGSVHRKVLLHAAEERNLHIKKLSPGLYTLSDGFKAHVFVEHALDTTTHVARLITDSKQLTRLCLKDAGICTPEGRSFPRDDREVAWRYACKIGLPVVLKPRKGTGGTGVTSNVASREHFDAAWTHVPRAEEVVVEKFIPGNDHRLFVVGDRMVCAAIREPASLVGDGVSTISDLIKLKNEMRSVNPYIGVKKMKLTQDMKYRLAASSMDENTVLEKGRKHILHPVANIGAGGESVDVTELVHPEFSQIAVRACKAVPGMLHGGIDLIAEDISKLPSSQVWAVIETNSVPDIALHHFPSEGTPRDAAGALLDHLFALA